MRIRHWASLALLAASLGLPLSSAHAEEPSDEIAALRERLDRLEAENRELKETVIQRLPAADEAVPVSINAEALAEGGELEKAVEKAMKAQEAKKKAADEAKKAEDAAKGYEVGSDMAMTATWKNGMEIASKNKDFRVHVGGRYQFDASWFDADPSVQNNINNRYSDGVDFRRARLRVDGTMYETIDWAAEFDFVNSDRLLRSPSGNAVEALTVPTDLWWTFTKLPVLGNVRVGNQKEAIGFEHMVSSRFLPFMERSYNQDTFYGGAFNGFTPGISAFNSVLEERATWNIGLYKPTTNAFAFNNNDGDYAITGRLTALPWYVDDGRGLLHLGFSGRQSTTADDRIRFRTRDAIRSGLSAQWPIPADTGNVFGSTMQWMNSEVAAVYGPWTLQAEYLVSILSGATAANAAGNPTGPDLGNLVYSGGYVQLMYFLTGESDSYSFERASFDRVKPRENFFLVNSEDSCRLLGRGAWQTGVRYNYLDLNDKGINGGQLHNFTAGLNWFLNPNMKVQFNYMMTYRTPSTVASANFPAGAGWIDGWGIRWAHDF
ncbi:MAG: OprO/OprP family phosphate-selective porin [Planctomycetaceae bacterium]